MRRRRFQFHGVALIATATVALFLLLDPFTSHSGETAILLMPPILGGFIWFGWPAVRRISWRHYASYLVVMGAVLTGAVAFIARVAGGRLLWIEVVWALYFVVAWRLAWAVWKRSVGVVGERCRRWGRRARRRAGVWRRIPNPRARRLALLALGISPLRFTLVTFVFGPLLVGSLIHRVKIGNQTEAIDEAGLPIETVSFVTADGLSISGWFLPEPDSDSTVVIAHGAGANKGNFLEYLLLFRGRGYSGLIFDFRGHGESDGHTTTFGLLETADVRAAVDWLKRERPEQARHVYGLGSSMGAMALVRAAAADPRIEAVVLDSCFVSAPLLARQHLKPFSVVGSGLGNLALAAMSLHAGRSMWDLDARPALAALAGRPVMFIHGQDDFVIPPVNMELLYAAADEPKTQWLAPGLHSNIITADFDEYQKRVIAFFDADTMRP